MNFYNVLALLSALFAFGAMLTYDDIRKAARSDTNAILVVPCEHSIPVLIFTHPDGSFTAVTPGAPPSEELISRIKRTKRFQVNLSCTKETLR